MTVKDLAERAQAEYIKALANSNKGMTAADLTKALAAPIVADPKTKALDDRTVFKRNFELSINETNYNPYDDIVAIRAFVQPDAATAEFRGWTSAQTIYTTITPGTISVIDARANQASANLHLGGPGALLPGASLSTTDTLTTTGAPNLGFQTDNLTIGFSPQQIQINRHGGQGVVLTGNIDFSASVKINRKQNGFIFAFKETPAAKNVKASAKLTAQEISAPKLGKNAQGEAQDVEATVILQYVVRHVTNGWESLAPGEQDTVYRTYTLAKQNVTLVPGTDLNQEFYGISLTTSMKVPPLGVIAGAGYNAVSLCFDNREDADAVIRYLRAHKTWKIGEATIGVLGEPPRDQGQISPIPAGHFNDLVSVAGCLPSGG